MAVPDRYGLTPRMRAIEEKQLQAAELLLELEQQQGGRQHPDVLSSETPQNKASWVVPSCLKGKCFTPHVTALWRHSRSPPSLPSFCR